MLQSIESWLAHAQENIVSVHVTSLKCGQSTIPGRSYNVVNWKRYFKV